MQSKRLGYIDAMRGYAILSVVISHIFTFTLCSGANLFNLVITELQLPLFFMVSGLVLRIPDKHIFSVVSKRMFALLVPATIFMLIYIWTANLNLCSTLFHSYKFGYWFTYSLFEFITIFICLTGLLRILNIRSIISDIIMIVAGIFILYFSTLCTRYHQEYQIIDLFGLTHLQYYIYFVIGFMISKYDLLNKLVNNRKSDLFVGGGIAAFFLIHIFTYNGETVRYLGSSTFWFMLSSLSGLVVILCVFRKYEALSESKAGLMLQYIGRHTLDIYFIHYFFIPRNLSMIGDWFKTNYNPIIELSLAMIVAALLIVASLMISKIIRLSPTLAHWLLGVNKSRQNA